MPIQLTIDNATKISDDIFLADLSPEEIGYFGGRPVKGGRKSVLIVEKAHFSEGTLKVSPDSAFIANVGSSGEVVIIDRQEVARREQSDFDLKNLSGDDPQSLSRVDPMSIDYDRPIAVESAAGSSNYYWVTVGKGLQGNFELGMSNGIWGVEGKYSDKIKPVRKGDFLLFYGREIGFALCKVEKELFEDRARIWPDGVYPYRIKISQPIRRDYRASLSDVFACLRDPENRNYDSVNAAGRAIGGAAGVFRPLRPNERHSLFTQLGWDTSDHSEGE